MKNLIYLTLSILLFSCGGNEIKNTISENLKSKLNNPDGFELISFSSLDTLKIVDHNFKLSSYFGDILRKETNDYFDFQIRLVKEAGLTADQAFKKADSTRVHKHRIVADDYLNKYQENNQGVFEITTTVKYKTDAGDKESIISLDKYLNINEIGNTLHKIEKIDKDLELMFSSLDEK